MKKALITGASGQDAYYLSKLLLEEGYKVCATQRRTARPVAPTIIGLLTNKNYSLVEADITDIVSIINAINKFKPTEFYHLGAQSEVGTSFGQPVTTMDITGMGTVNCLEAVRMVNKDIRFYFAGSSEMYGDTHDLEYLDENSPMIPRSPYAAAKLMGYHMSRIYRESYGMFICCGILFNHESKHRKKYFVTRKITSGVVDIIRKNIDKIRLGNINSGRDWGHSEDYMKAAHMMLQHSKPDDYVVATGKFHTIRDVLDIAFDKVGIDYWEPYVEHDTPENMRPHDVIRLIGNSSKIQKVLGWKPKYSFKELITDMVDFDLRQADGK